MFDLYLLAAGLSALLGVKVIIPEDGLDTSHVPKLSMDDVFDATYIPLPLEEVEKGKSFDIHVKTLGGGRSTVSVKHDSNMESVKAAVQEKEGVPVEDQMLVFNGQVLKDSDTVESAGIPNGGTVMKTRSEGVRIQLMDGEEQSNIHFTIASSYFDPRYNYDFTYMHDNGQVFYRGYHYSNGKLTSQKYRYYRPYGWYRYALKVTGKYENNDWLGPAVCEWPNSYHGTKFDSAMSIIKTAFRIGPRAAFGRGVYSAPKVGEAERYATTFYQNGQRYKLVLQNRVNPMTGHLNIVNSGRYYVSPLQDESKCMHDVRPYGILIKRA